MLGEMEGWKGKGSVRWVLCFYQLIDRPRGAGRTHTLTHHHRLPVVLPLFPILAEHMPEDIGVYRERAFVNTKADIFTDENDTPVHKPWLAT